MCFINKPLPIFETITTKREIELESSLTVAEAQFEEPKELE